MSGTVTENKDRNYSNTEMIQTLQKLVRYPSISSEDETSIYGHDTEEAVDYLMGTALSLGLRICKTKEYAYIETGEGTDLIGVLAHIDVVPPGEGWTKDPFSGEISNDRIYGRGTTDDKGPLVAVLYAMADLVKVNPQKKIRLIIGQSEENGQWDDIEAYCEKEQLPDAGFSPDGDFPAIQCEKGALVFKVSMKADKSGIVDARGGSSANMVPDYAQITTKSGNYSGKGIKFHGCAPWLGKNAITDAVTNGISSGDKAAFLQMYSALIGETVFGENLGIKMEDEISGKLSVNAGELFMDNENQDVCILIDIRYPCMADADKVIAAVEEKFHSYGAQCKCIYRSEPLRMDPCNPLMEKLLDAYRTETGDYSDPISIGGGTYAKAMPNIVAFGPNFPGHENREHRNDEYIRIDDLIKLRAIYKRALLNLTECREL